MTNRGCTEETISTDNNTEKKNKVFVVSPFGFPFEDVFAKMHDARDELKYSFRKDDLDIDDELKSKLVKKKIIECDPNNSNNFSFDNSIKCEGCIKQKLENETDSENIEKIVSLWKKAAKRVLEIERANRIPQLGFIMCQKICKPIRESNYIIVDISYNNPNVFYELGLAYALGKKIILIGQRSFKDEREESLCLKKEHKSAYHQYTTPDDIKKIIKQLPSDRFSSFIKKEKKSAPIKSTINEEDILSIRFAGDSEFIHSLQEEAVKNAVKKVWGFDEIHTANESLSSSALDIYGNISKRQVVIVDTTSRDAGMFFCLGVGHGLEKDVVPITRTGKRAIDNLPFDVAALWHIAFSKEEELVDNLIEVFGRIKKNKTEESEHFQNLKFWEPFIKILNKDAEKKIKIITCSRPGKTEYRGKRSSIDSFDYKSVAQLSSFLPTIMPNSKIEVKNLAKIQLDMQNYDEELSEEEKDRLVKHINYINEKFILDSNCIVVGSPDVNDVAEVALSRIHQLKSFRGRAEGKPVFQDIKPRFLIYKKHIVPGTFHIMEKELPVSERSSTTQGVYKLQLGTDGEVNIKEDRRYPVINESNNKAGTDIGVITFSKTINEDKRKEYFIIILAGFSGPGTLGLAKLLTSSDCVGCLEELNKKLSPLIERSDTLSKAELIVKTSYCEECGKTGEQRMADKVTFEVIDQIF